MVVAVIGGRQYNLGVAGAHDENASPKWLRFPSFNDPHLPVLHCSSRCFTPAFPLHQLL